MTPEGALQKTILDWLAAKRVLAFRMNTGAVKTDARFFRFGVPGMADIVAFVHRFWCPECGWSSKHICDCGWGRVIPEVYWIEVKTKTGRQSELQRSFQKQVEDAGHRYVLARNLDAVIEAKGG
jgi:hypothetical protein